MSRSLKAISKIQAKAASTFIKDERRIGHHMKHMTAMAEHYVINSNDNFNTTRQGHQKFDNFLPTKDYWEEKGIPPGRLLTATYTCPHTGNCCDMSCDCLSKYHGRASRDALRAWSGWASTVIHGPRYEPDYGPRYEQDYGQRYAPSHRAPPRVGRFGPPGRATSRAAGPCYASGRRAAPRAGPRAMPIYSAIAPLDLRTNGRTTPIHTVELCALNCKCLTCLPSTCFCCF